ncbi:hypothetical protein RHMOL_Rhmol04G0132000 [Rhododendron molle]|uniref:Uncharacterized protein n=1 Tax=Rhododendron molle TaxID=49168 RepID=A0ACC0P2A8_RHOML|nr:hypothetical protein RHMOL_Rhmol04G0132000 [Rhododendron molle]
MIIIDELPFKFVEGEGFRRFMHVVQPNWGNIPGETLGKVIEQCLLEWGIDKCLTITVDNAHSNSAIIKFLKRKTTILEHEFLHVRCCAHILNLIVCEGVKEIEVSIARVRNTVRYVRSSPSRMAKFKSLVEKEGIVSQSQPCLDVPTRWNYTYFMLERALTFQTAFERLEDDEPQLFSLSIREDEIGEDDEPEDVVSGDVVPVDDAVVEDVVSKSKENGKGRGKGKAKSRKETLGPPTSDDWQNALLYVKFLKLFYDATLKFSGSKYVTCNGFFEEMMLIRNAIMSLCVDGEEKLKLLANGMRTKFDRYWGKLDKINCLLLIANVLDPRYKLKYIKMHFVLDYGKKTAEDMIDKLKNEMTRLYAWYENRDSSKNHQTQTAESSTRGSDLGKGNLDEREKMMSQFIMYLEEENDMVARDVLSILVSTVASESAFSTGGSILDPFRSNLAPKTVEALVCTQNWLRSPIQINIQEQLDELEKLDEELMETGSCITDE